MSSVVEIPASEREILAPLFRANRFDTVLMNSTLEGNFGAAHADSGTAPRLARLDSGSFTVFGGDPGVESASTLIRCNPISYVTPETGEWRRVLEGEFGSRISRLPFTEFSARSLDVDHLSGLTRELQDGFVLSAVDKPLALRLATDLENEYFLEHFESIDDFLERGMGFCVVHEDAIVSAASSTASCRGGIDIEIETAPDFQRRGLGTVVGARLVLECLKNNIEPKWLAANPASEKLAERIGYLKSGAYETFEIIPARPGGTTTSR